MIRHNIKEEEGMDAVTCLCPQKLDSDRLCGAKFFWYVKSLEKQYQTPLLFVPCWKCKNVNMIKLDSEGSLLVQSTDGDVRPKI